MSDFKFRVGEEVIADGTHFVQVHKFLFFSWTTKRKEPNYVEGFISERSRNSCTGVNLYRIDGKAFAEECLRRKLHPGDSFDTLMTNLKNPQRIEA